MSAREILEAMRLLPELERRRLAKQIEKEFGEFDPGLTPEQIVELDRRAEDALKNPGRGTPAEEVFTEIKERLLGKK